MTELIGYTIRKMIDDFENGQILIPTFQREFVWSNSQIVTLAESIYKGYPVGIMIFFEWIENGKNNTWCSMVNRDCYQWYL